MPLPSVPDDYDITELTLPSPSRFRTRLTRDVHIPVIVTTTDEAALVPPEAAGVLIKPFALATLLHEVRRVLTRTQPAAEGNDSASPFVPLLRRISAPENRDLLPVLGRIEFLRITGRATGYREAV